MMIKIKSSWDLSIKFTRLFRLNPLITFLFFSTFLTPNPLTDFLYEEFFFFVLAVRIFDPPLGG